jgi:hypothetical protein
MAKRLICDPPEGWRYGFPKEIPHAVPSTEDWLVEQGYPRERIRDLGEFFYVRYWEEDDGAK